MPIEKRSVEAALLQKGFEPHGGDHHYFIYYSRDGKKSLAKTKTSHTPKMKTISDGLLGGIARQCFLTTQEFRELVACPLTRERYEKLLRERDAL